MSVKPYIPYSGCKQRISGEIVKLIRAKCPDKDTAIDLFGGGGAMSFEFLQQGYQRVVYNELNTGYYNLLLFLKRRREYCLQNGSPLTLPNYFYDFVDKSKYGNIKLQNDKSLDTQQLAYKYFVLAVYTFNNLQGKSKNSTSGYLYGKDTRDGNCCIHQALVRKDKSALQQIKTYFAALGTLTNLLDCCLQANLQKAIYDFGRYISIITFLFDNLSRNPQVSPIIARLNDEYKKDKNYFDKRSQRELCRLFMLYGLKPRSYKMSCGDNIRGAFSCDHLQRILHIQAILQLPLEKLDLYNCNYLQFPFRKYNNFVVLCDPPYFSTQGYDSGRFDFSKFSGWCYNFQNPLFICEITNPNPNKLISIWHHCIKDNVSAKKLRKEQLFYNCL